MTRMCSQFAPDGSAHCRADTAKRLGTAGNRTANEAGARCMQRATHLSTSKLASLISVEMVVFRSSSLWPSVFTCAV